jgi:hypothetical protein
MDARARSTGRWGSGLSKKATGVRQQVNGMPEREKKERKGDAT